MAVPDWADREKVKADLIICGRAANISWFIAGAFAVLGVIGDAANVVLGLESESWFLLAIATFLAIIIFRIGWAVAWYLITTDAKSKKEE